MSFQKEQIPISLGWSQSSKQKDIIYFLFRIYFLNLLLFLITSHLQKISLGISLVFVQLENSHNYLKTVDTALILFHPFSGAKVVTAMLHMEHFIMTTLAVVDNSL